MKPVLDSLLPIYTYCESVSGVIAQPLNFLSCAVFWLGAVWMYYRDDLDDERPSFHQVAAIILFLLGLTGMAWHVSSAPLALAADMFLLFLLFIIIAVVVSSDVLRWSLSKGLVVIIMLIICGALLKNEEISMLPHNGGLFLPLLFFLPLAALKVQKVCEEATVYLLSSAYMLFFGLVFYCIDGLMCSYFQWGTHFLWHIMIVLSVIYAGRTIVAMKAVPWPEETETAMTQDTPQES